MSYSVYVCLVWDLDSSTAPARNGGCFIGRTGPRSWDDVDQVQVTRADTRKEQDSLR